MLLNIYGTQSLHTIIILLFCFSEYCDQTEHQTHQKKDYVRYSDLLEVTQS